MCSSDLDGTWTKDEVKVTVIHADADVDSDNTEGTKEWKPDEFEDRIEDADGKTNLPGKILCVNDGDFDNDGIPDFADGFDLVAGESKDNIIGSVAGEKPSFIPLVIKLPKPLDLTKLRLKIEYSDASDPRSERRCLGKDCRSQWSPLH